MNTSFLLKSGATAAMACLLGFNSQVLALSINDLGVVGTISGGSPANPANEIFYVNTLLGLTANQTMTINGLDRDHTYQTSATDYNGSVSALGLKDETGNVVVSGGWEYVLAKYGGGDNGGDVLWFLGGAGITLPTTSAGIWVNNARQGYGISHFSVFNRTTNVPDGGMTLSMLGMGLVGLGFVARRIKK